jgi:hypothetical protein
MLETVVSFLLVFAIAAWFGLLSVFKSFQQVNVAQQSTSPDKLKIPEDSMLKRHFLTHLQSEIESTLVPRPTDFMLQRHYDSLVAAELKNRLSQTQ